MESPQHQEVVWRPSAEMVERANLTAFLRAHDLPDYETLVRRSHEDMTWFWDTFIKWSGYQFYRPYDTVVDLSAGLPWAKWCVGGTTNVVLNAIDKHRGTAVWEQEALSWEGEDGRRRAWTYAELNAEVCRCAEALRELGFGRGDVIALYVPFLPESVAALIAIAKIGAIILPLFSGFGASAVADRMNDAGAVGVVTVDGTWRRGNRVLLKPVIDEVAGLVPTLRHTLVIANLGEDVPMRAGRDRWWHEALAGNPEDSPTEEMDAEAPLLLAFTSGTTGKAKGTILTHCGFPLKIALDLGLVSDFQPGDRIIWMSDMGWIVGPYKTFCATTLKGTMVIAEGGPDYPEPGRMWRIVQDHKVSYLGVAPTIVRSLKRYGVEEVEKYDLSSVRVGISTGESWTPDAWMWFFNHVGKGRVPLNNLTGGTEMGGGIISTTVIHPMKPGCFAGPIPGSGADVVDDQGRSLPPGQLGELVCRQPSIGMTRGLWRDEGGARYLDAYWNKIPGMWVHGDHAYRDEDGFWFVPGRSDDAFNVAGKRTGPAEVEALLLATQRVAEAAVIGVPDEIKGNDIVCVCVAAEGAAPDADTVETLNQAVMNGLGKPFRPREILFVSDLPRTRNMKIMRRLVRAAYAGEPPGDLSALLNPESVEELQAVLGGRRA